MTSLRFRPHRLLILQLCIVLAAVIIIARLFYLQILKHNYYYAVAQKEHYGYTKLPARRGNILIEDQSSGENFKLATNTTFYTVYADPVGIPQKETVAKALSPLLFDIVEEKYFDELRVKTEIRNAKTEEKRRNIRYFNDEELKKTSEQRLLEKISQEIRPQILLYEYLNEEVAKIIEKADFPGLYIKNNNLYALPKDITTEKERQKIADFLKEFIDIPPTNLVNILRGKNRYVILKRKVSPEIIEQIQNLMSEDPENFRGIGFQEKYYRLYPEGELAAQVLGFVNSQGQGQYGIESAFNTELEGKNGIFSSETDVYGNQITVGDSIIRPAIDGSDVYLTIDRAVQLAIERKLQRAVEEYRADSGIVIVMEPKTFKMISMSTYPTFNPNEYGKVFEKKEIQLTDDEIKRLIPLNEKTEPDRFLLYINKEREEKIEIFREENEFGEKVFKIYKNHVGPYVYRNRAVTDIYEPGSVFKVITMASALNDNDVTPNTTIYESGPIKVDCHPDKITGQEVCDFEIRNALDRYRGRLNMTQVLQHSSNIGISQVVQKLGRTLFYSYLKNFGFAEKTDIEFEEENRGNIEFFEKWSQSELITHGFGQGIAVTPIQLISGISTIANGGTLMQPHIISKIRKENGEIIENEPKAIRQVIKKETADILTYMMTAVVEKGTAPKAKLNKHYIAGKSGTAQTYKHGKALSGVGTTMASFTGFGPVNDPRFSILVILERPRTSEWADATAAPLFAEVAQFLYDYYNIPPDK